MALNRAFWLKWHWRIGLCAALFIAIIALTGLLLNHARLMNLHNIHIDNPALLSLYHMQMPDDYIQDIEFTVNGAIVATQDGKVVLEKTDMDQNRVHAIIAQRYRGKGITLEKLILDLHTGAVIGLPGKMLSDLAALALLFLSGTGIYNWMKRKP